MTRVRLDDRSISLFKTHASRQLPGVRYGHVLEVIARGLRFNTWAALTAHRKGLAAVGVDSSHVAVAPARPIDIGAMRGRLDELGHTASAPLSFVPFEDDVHFLGDIDGISVEHMTALRSLFSPGVGAVNPAAAVARMLICDRDSTSAAAPRWASVPALDILRDMEYIGPYDVDFDSSDVQALANELMDVNVTKTHDDVWMRFQVFGELRWDIRPNGPDGSAYFQFAFTQSFLELLTGPTAAQR